VYVNLKPGCNLTTGVQALNQAYLNTSCFSNPAFGQLGNGGIPFRREVSWLHSEDLGILKNFVFGLRSGSTLQLAASSSMCSTVREWITSSRTSTIRASDNSSAEAESARAIGQSIALDFLIFMAWGSRKRLPQILSSRSRRPTVAGGLPCCGLLDHRSFCAFRRTRPG